MPPGPLHYIHCLRQAHALIRAQASLGATGRGSSTWLPADPFRRPCGVDEATAHLHCRVRGHGSTAHRGRVDLFRYKSAPLFDDTCIFPDAIPCRLLAVADMPTAGGAMAVADMPSLLLCSDPWVPHGMGGRLPLSVVSVHGSFGTACGLGFLAQAWLRCFLACRPLWVLSRDSA